MWWRLWLLSVTERTAIEFHIRSWLQMTGDPFVGFMFYSVVIYLYTVEETSETCGTLRTLFAPESSSLLQICTPLLSI